MMRKVIVGVMGPGEGARSEDCQLAYGLGQLIAEQGWVLLTGGRNVGVMEAANRGAKQAQGLTLGILPGTNDQNCSAAVDIAICTGIGNARNLINVLSCRVVIVCGMGAGTASEVALALKTNRPVILLQPEASSQVFFQTLAPNQVFVAETPEDAIAIAQKILLFQQAVE
jgi:uncharacterized protein (TIGR00725 family)